MLSRLCRHVRLSWPILVEAVESVVGTEAVVPRALVIEVLALTETLLNCSRLTRLVAPSEGPLRARVIKQERVAQCLLCSQTQVCDAEKSG